MVHRDDALAIITFIVLVLIFRFIQKINRKK